MVRIIASRDHQMMVLMMHPPGHHTHESKRAEFPGIFRGCDDAQVRARLSLGGGEFPVQRDEYGENSSGA